MNTKKVISLAAMVLFTTVAFIVSFTSLTLWLQYITENAASNLEYSIEFTKKINIARIISSVVFLAIAFICWVALIIESTKINNQIESHFLLLLSILSFIPIFSFGLLVRAKYLYNFDSAKKINISVQEDIKYGFNNPLQQSTDIIKQTQTAPLNMYANTQEINANHLDKNVLTEEKPIEKQVQKMAEQPISQPVVETKPIKPNILFDQPKVEENKPVDIKAEKPKVKLDKPIETKKEIDNNKEEVKPINNFDFQLPKTSTPNRSMDLSDHDKYLSLKGTNYSKEKADGKKKIKKGKWKSLIELFEQLQRDEITEKDFYREKDKLLSN